MENKKAYYNFEILDKYTAGLILKGNEVSVLNENRCNFKDNSFIFINDSNQLILKGLHFSKLKKFDSLQDFQEEREITLLLNKKEINKISKKIEEKGFTCVPLKISRIKGFYKLEIGIGRGKKTFDKKNSIKEKDLDRQLKQDLKNDK